MEGLSTLPRLCEYGVKNAFFCLLQAGEHNFLSSYSRNLGFVDLPIPVDGALQVGPVRRYATVASQRVIFPKKATRQPVKLIIR